MGEKQARAGQMYTKYTLPRTYKEIHTSTRVPLASNLRPEYALEGRQGEGQVGTHAVMWGMIGANVGFFASAGGCLVRSTVLFVLVSWSASNHVRLQPRPCPLVRHVGQFSADTLGQGVLQEPWAGSWDAVDENVCCRSIFVWWKLQCRWRWA